MFKNKKATNHLLKLSLGLVLSMVALNSNSVNAVSQETLKRTQAVQAKKQAARVAEAASVAEVAKTKNEKTSPASSSSSSSSQIPSVVPPPPPPLPGKKSKSNKVEQGASKPASPAVGPTNPLLGQIQKGKKLRTTETGSKAKKTAVTESVVPSFNSALLEKSKKDEVSDEVTVKDIDNSAEWNDEPVPSDQVIPKIVTPTPPPLPTAKKPQVEKGAQKTTRPAAADLAAQGKKLKKSDVKEKSNVKVVAVPPVAQENKNDLATDLAAALKTRRRSIGDDEGKKEDGDDNWPTPPEQVAPQVVPQVVPPTPPPLPTTKKSQAKTREFTVKPPKPQRK